jgi:signal transduction histidine kinase
VTALRRIAAPTLTPGLSVALWGVCVAIVLAVLAGLVLGDEDVAGYRIAFRLVGAAFVACGLIAWRRRPDSHSGLLMTATGFLLFVEPLAAQFSSPEVTVVGDLFQDLWSITIVWLLLTMLSGGRLVTTTDRVLVGAFIVEFALTFGSALFWERDGNFLLIRADAGLADGFEAVRALLVSVACVAIAVVIGLRWRAASRPRRRALLPSVAGISVLLFFAVAQQAAPIWLRWLAVLSLLLIPAGFLVGLLRSRLARGGLADLFRELPSMRGAELQAALARTLGDPDLTVVHADGRSLPPAAEGRRAVPIEHEGRSIAALHYDASLDDDPELVEAVAAAATLALEHERLHEQSAARLAELMASRERLVSAGDTERRRLERNLHDGAQQRLVALAMQLRLLQMQISSDPVAAEKLVTTASEELALSLAELRELARGIHPAVLDHGLPVALEALTGHSTVPTSLMCNGAEGLPEAVELAAYFVTSEALANVAKYARATAASVHVSHRGPRLVVEIADDGVGGADASRGSGLRGLADRVEALDGRLTVVSPPGNGTIVTAELPHSTSAA